MKLALFLTATLLCSVSFAGNTSAIPSPNVETISAIHMDLNGDGDADIASLMTSPDTEQDELDLWIKLASDKQYYVIPAVVYNNTNGMAGVGTELTVNAAGSLQIHSYNDAIGRSRWEEHVTFAFRNKTFVTAGYTMFMRDTIDLSYSKCDVNLLSLKGELTGSNANGTFEVLKEDVPAFIKTNADQLNSTFVGNYCNSIEGAEPENG